MTSLFSRRDWVCVGVLLVLGLAVYPGIWTARFSYEDVIATRGFATKLSDLTHLGWNVPGATYLLDRILGNTPMVYHLDSLLWHIVNGVLLYLGMRAVWNTWPAMLTAGLFVVHPLQSMGVYYIAARSDLLMTAGCLGVLGSILWLQQTKEFKFVVAGFLWAILALLSKPVGVCVIPLGTLVWMAGDPLVDHPRRRQTDWLLSVILLIPLTGVVVLRTLQTYLAVIHSTLSPWNYYCLQMAQVTLYLGMFLIPGGFGGLSIEHDPELIAPWVTWGFGIVWLGVIGIAGVLWIGRGRLIEVSDRIRWGLCGFLWFVISILPRLVLRVPDTLTEQHLYLGVAGLTLCVGALALPAERTL